MRERAEPAGTGEGPDEAEGTAGRSWDPLRERGAGPDRYIRPAITFVIFASGLKYIGVGTYALGFTMGAVLVAGLGYWLVRTRSWRAHPEAPEQAPSLEPVDDVPVT